MISGRSAGDVAGFEAPLKFAGSRAPGSTAGEPWLRDSGSLVDNLFADLWKQVGMKTLLSRAGFRKRSGTPMHEVVYGLVLWVWLRVDSIGMFARDSIRTFAGAEKDALYSFMNREDLNWRRLHLHLA